MGKQKGYGNSLAQVQSLSIHPSWQDNYEIKLNWSKQTRATPSSEAGAVLQGCMNTRTYAKTIKPLAHSFQGTTSSAACWDSRVSSQDWGQLSCNIPVFPSLGLTSNFIFQKSIRTLPRVYLWPMSALQVQQVGLCFCSVSWYWVHKLNFAPSRALSAFCRVPEGCVYVCV